MLIDWDTVGLAPPERDLWMVATETGAELRRYTELTGRPVDMAAIELYRLRWALDDLSCFVRDLRAPHRRTPGTEHAWQALPTHHHRASPPTPPPPNPTLPRLIPPRPRLSHPAPDSTPSHRPQLATPAAAPVSPWPRSAAPHPAQRRRCRVVRTALPASKRVGAPAARTRQSPAGPAQWHQSG